MVYVDQQKQSLSLCGLQAVTRLNSAYCSLLLHDLSAHKRNPAQTN